MNILNDFKDYVGTIFEMAKIRKKNNYENDNFTVDLCKKFDNDLAILIAKRRDIQKEIDDYVTSRRD